MEKRVSYFVSPKSVLTWLAIILLACSVSCRIAFFCGKGTDAATMWLGLILPLAACLFYVMVVLMGGRERLYRTAVPFAMMCAYIAWNAGVYLENTWFSVLLWLVMFVILVVYNLAFTGRFRRNWLLVLVLLAVLGTQVTVFMDKQGANVLHWHFRAYADLSMMLGVLFTVFAMRPHVDGAYHPTWGDRPEARRIRTLDPMMSVATYLMPTRNGANNSIYSSVEITEMEKYIRKKRMEGLTSFGITHVFMAAYARCVALYPGMNRFLSGNKIYNRDRELVVNMTVKKDMTLDSSDTVIKLKLDVADTAYDVYEKLNKAVEEVKNTPLNSDMDKTAAMLNYIPGILLRFVVFLLKVLDYYGLVPRFLLDVSPFHGSAYFTSMGSLGIPPVVHHLYDFGNVPLFCAFGCKRKAYELNAEGKVEQKKYVDFSFNIDERTVDGFYYATVLKTFCRILQHPERLDTPPENIVRDVD